MLHITWLLIKFILITLGVLLGLVLLCVLLILFCPVRYRVRAVKSGPDWKKVSGTAGVSWLFEGIRFQVLLEDGRFRFGLRLLGISLDRFLNKKTDREESSGAEAREGEKDRGRKEMPEGNFSGASGEMEDKLPGESAEEQKNLPIKKDEKSSKEETPGASRKAQGKKSSADPKKKNPDARKKKAVPEKDSAQKKKPEKAGQKASGENKIRSVWEKLKRIPERIGDVFRNLSRKIQAIRSKIDWWKEFLTHPKTVEAVSRVKKWLIRLLKHIFPTKIGGNVTFGSENPAVTGAVLSVMGATIPFHKNNVELCPLFEGNNVIQGEIWLKGRVYGIVLLVTALQVLFDKNIRFVISRWKHRAG